MCGGRCPLLFLYAPNLITSVDCLYKQLQLLMAESKMLSAIYLTHMCYIFFFP